MSSSRTLRILCCREIQKSIKESVHRLISDRIEALGVGGVWSITDKVIRNTENGSEFFFEGLFRNVDAIKSIEGVDIAWVEEAHRVTDPSWELLTPTIRSGPVSEIWVSFNPMYEDDSTYQRFVVDPPDNCISKMVNFHDNPYFPEVLRIEMEHDKARDNILYQQKWLGLPKGTGGKVFPPFDPKIHVKTFDRKQIAMTGNSYMTMDPHGHYYPFCIWMAIIPKNERKNWPEDFHRHVYAEWPSFDDLQGYYHEVRKKLFYTGDLAGMAREIYARDGIEDGIKIVKRFIDSRYAKGAGAWNWSTSTVGIVDLFAKQENGGLQFELPAEKVIDAQKHQIRSDMLYNLHAPVNEFNQPTFSVDPSCKNVIKSLANHRLEEDPRGDGSMEKESEKYKDPCDALRICYAGVSDAKYIPPGGEKKLTFGSGSMGGGSWMR